MRRLSTWGAGSRDDCLSRIADEEERVHARSCVQSREETPDGFWNQHVLYFDRYLYYQKHRPKRWMQTGRRGCDGRTRTGASGTYSVPLGILAGT